MQQIELHASFLGAQLHFASSSLAQDFFEKPG
jgi:hypothetical protein